jgi:L-ribulose-5-phosphate 4-epimerase
VSYDALKQTVCRANVAIADAGLVTLTWGNASGADRDANVMAIKPSGVGADVLRPEDIVVLSIESGEVLDGALRPSSDAPTHLHLYRALPNVGGIVHTHSRYASSWAQAERDLPCLGTTHADHFHGPVPCTRRLTGAEIAGDYEHETGAVIVETFRARGGDPDAVPAALVAGHGPFAWGPTVAKAVENAVALEAAAQMAFQTLMLNAHAADIDRALLDRHYLRKHGVGAYYGQR